MTSPCCPTVTFGTSRCPLRDGPTSPTWWWPQSPRSVTTVGGDAGCRSTFSRSSRGSAAFDLDLGLERAGMTIVGQVEIDPFCQRVLAKHWPEVPQHDDVRTCVEWWRSEPRPRVDLVCGGFPCQPVSVAGSQRGRDDERWLWPIFAEVLRGLRPRYAVLENVPGLLRGWIGDVLGDLAALGYDAEWDCIPASAFGAPHRRDRWFAVAYTAGCGEQDEPECRNGAAFPVSAQSGAGRGTDGRCVAPGADEPGRGTSIMASAVADTNGSGHERGTRIFRPPGWGQPADSDQWAVEPDVGRVVTRIPARLDGGINAVSRVNRIKALGNAVVPQIAEHIGRLVLAADRGCSRSPR